MNRVCSPFRKWERSSTTESPSSTITSAMSSPELTSRGMSPWSPPMMTMGNPSRCPSADERRPHQTPTGSATTTGRLALSISSTITADVYVFPAPRLARMAKVSVTASAGRESSLERDSDGHIDRGTSGKSDTDKYPYYKQAGDLDKPA